MVRGLLFRRSESLVVWLIFVIEQVAVICHIEGDSLASDRLLGRGVREINVHGNLAVFVGVKVVVDDFELTEMLGILELEDTFALLFEEQGIGLVGR